MIDIDIDEMQQLCLHTNATADQLWERWEFLRELLDEVGKTMAAACDRWKEATDPEARDQLWAVYEATARDYRVLASWKDLHYAAYIFCTDGAHCTVLDTVSSTVS